MALWTLQHLSMKQVWTEWESTTVILANGSGKSPCFLTRSLSFDCSTHVLDYKHLTRAYSCTFPSRRVQSLVSLWAIALQTCILNGGALSMHKGCSKWMLMCNMDCMILGLIECGEGHNAAHWRGGAKTISLTGPVTNVAVVAMLEEWAYSWTAQIHAVPSLCLCGP
jgi:hypothetical protein